MNHGVSPLDPGSGPGWREGRAFPGFLKVHSLHSEAVPLPALACNDEILCRTRLAKAGNKGGRFMGSSGLSQSQIILLVLPLVIIELGLLGFALYDLIKRKKVKGGNKWVWGVVIVFVNFIGPIVYLVLGRGEE
jgi:hypothetical protein